MTNSREAALNEGVVRKESAKERYVEKMFAGIAGWYDKLNTLLSMGQHHRWRRISVEQCCLNTGQSAIDVCAGTGDFSMALAKIVGPTGQVLGIDFCEDMLAVGRRKVAKAGLDNIIKLELGNAEMITYPDGSFQAATVGFGARNVDSLHALFSEMGRVVADGGKVVCLELSKPRAWGLRHLYNFYFYKLVPLIGNTLSKQDSAYTYLPNSLTRFPDVEKVKAIMEETGLVDVCYYPLTFGIVTIHVGTVRKTTQLNSHATS